MYTIIERLNYDSVILHVVWGIRYAYFRKDNSEIPTLELKNMLPFSDLHKYQSLISQKVLDLFVKMKFKM